MYNNCGYNMPACNCGGNACGNGFGGASWLWILLIIIIICGFGCC